MLAAVDLLATSFRGISMRTEVGTVEISTCTDFLSLRAQQGIGGNVKRFQTLDTRTDLPSLLRRNVAYVTTNKNLRTPFFQRSAPTDISCRDSKAMD